MGSLYLANLGAEQMEALRKRLHETQHGACFICGKPIDLTLQAGHLDIDHVEPLAVGGKDGPENFALTHASCNRSKQAADLRVARVLRRFDDIREAAATENRGPNLGDVLRAYGGAKHPLVLEVDGEEVRYSFPDLGDNEIRRSPLYTDPLSGVRYFFAELPIEYLHHDDVINPRAIGSNLGKLVDEFHRKYPQLHVSLGWVELNGEHPPHVKVFDGQHKAAAQVLLGVRRLPVRVFVNPDRDALLTANTHAGTTLRQVAFDKSVQRHLGNTLYWDRIQRYRKERGLAEDDFSFSERELVKHFKGETTEMKRYILDSVRDSITHHPDNRLKEFVDFGGRAKEKPLSYSTIEKTFYSFFIYQGLLEVPLDHELETGKNPRELERSQIVRLMNIIAEEILIPDFDPALGTHQLEHKVQKGEDIPEPHLRAHRMMREEILYVWLGYVRQIVQNYFTMMLGKPLQDDRLFQYAFPEPLWDRIRNYVRNLKGLPMWVNKELSITVFGGKQTYDFWHLIFETGKSPQGHQVLAAPINLMEMIQE
jgi:hypothetical protein